MSLALLIHDGGLRLIRIPGQPALVETLDILRPEDAERLLAQFAGHTESMQVLRHYLAEDAHLTTSAALSDNEVIRQTAHRVAAGQVDIARVVVHRSSIVEGTADQPAQPPPPTTVRKKLTYIEFVVVRDETGEPVPWVALEITLPDGSKESHTTDRDGLVRIEDIDPGTCDVSCKIDNARLPGTFNYVTVGGSAVVGVQSGAVKTDTTVKRIAEIEAHKVVTGESIKSLAEDNGMTWQQLAKFNWGTEVPDEINVHLRNEVGCTKKTEDGNNYVFDSSDNPGIVFIPHVWLEESLVTGQTHVIRVGVTKRVLCAWLGVQVFFHRMPIKDLLVRFYKANDDDSAGAEVPEPPTADDASPKLRTDADGIARHGAKVEIGNYICQIENQAEAHISTVSEEKDLTMLVLPIGRPHYEFDSGAKEVARKQQEVGVPTEPEA